jgi:hypothetical protein
MNSIPWIADLLVAEVPHGQGNPWFLPHGNVLDWNSYAHGYRRGFARHRWLGTRSGLSANGNTHGGGYDESCHSNGGITKFGHIVSLIGNLLCDNDL